jgi:hypothetical protein
VDRHRQHPGSEENLTALAMIFAKKGSMLTPPA